MEPVERIIMRDNVVVVTIDRLPNVAGTMAKVFRVLADEGINVDMISSLLPASSEIGVSFSTEGDELTRLMGVSRKVQSIFPGAAVHINSGNAKLVLGGYMAETAGVGARAFACLGAAEIEIRLITTSENEISLVVNEGNADAAAEALAKEFGCGRYDSCPFLSQNRRITGWKKKSNESYVNVTLQSSGRILTHFCPTIRRTPCWL